MLLFLFLFSVGQALVSLAEEIAQSSIPEGSGRINGKFIQSHLLSRLEVLLPTFLWCKAVHEKVKEQIKDVDTAQSKEVPLFWCGMAESVQVMGTLMAGVKNTYLQIMMVLLQGMKLSSWLTGEWHLSPEFPTVGEGLMKNNLLIVEVAPGLQFQLYLYVIEATCISQYGASFT
ncbi:hypothetical protein Patl1_21282 [Pistacia atlantica]|uniref:Uncharacterized protein n=1 Tax=Pistacia atlantica TaxID=434234 RepID=A0ACC1BM16_9ROSI|nr:hypothetical protein Patl1_21282 [Pistacia atlantica]